MQYTQISLDVADNVATVTLDRPDKMNAFTELMASELVDAFDRIDADDDVRAAIVTGRGRAFCAGADLSGSANPIGGDRSPVAEDHAERESAGVVSLRVFNCVKPVIAAINGHAVGVGITMTLPMDIRVISSEAKVGFVFSRRGITPEGCSTYFLPRLVGISRAAEWCYSGRLLTAAEAHEGGLVRSVHAPGDVLPAAHAIAREIIDHAAPVSVATTRQMLWRMLGATHPMEAHRAESRALFQRGRSADGAEGARSFLERRLPQFPMRVSDGLPDAFPDWEDPTF